MNTAGIEIDTKFGGGRTFFSGDGLFLLKATGTGTIFRSSDGAVHQLDLAPGQQYVVDTGHMVAFDESVTYEVTQAAGWKSTLFGGEGMVVRLTGPGRFYMQNTGAEQLPLVAHPEAAGPSRVGSDLPIC